MRLLLCVLMLIASLDLMACGNKTRISNQTQFDEAIKRINNGEEMHLVLNRGRYVLNQPLTAKVPVSIEGKNAVVTSTSELYTPQQSIKTAGKHYVYKINRPLSLFPLFYDNLGNVIPISESVIDSVRVNYIDGEIIAPGEYGKGVDIKIPIPSNLRHLRNKSFTNAFGYFDCGWCMVNFSLNKTDGDYLYCTTLTECYPKNFQYDRKTYKKPMRFVLYNAEIKPDAIFYDAEYLYVPKNAGSVYCLNNIDGGYGSTRLVFNSDVLLSGIEFCGIDGIVIDSKAESICEVRNCLFRNTLGSPLSLNRKISATVKIANVEKCQFKNCSIYDSYVLSLKSDYGDETFIRVADCEIARYPDAVVFYKNSVPSVNVSGNVVLCHNVLYNNCRGHLALNRGKIIAKDNVIYNTDGFYRLWKRNSSNDWGLIYCNHIFKDKDDAVSNTLHSILLEDNLLYGAYAYGGDARGIFIDDGRGDVTCRGNIILNTQAYSIDARDSRFTDASSVRVCYEKNLVTTIYRLQTGPAVEDVNQAMTRANVSWTKKNNEISKIKVLTEDICVEGGDVSFTCSDSCINVSEDLYKAIRKTTAWKSINKYVKKIR